MSFSPLPVDEDELLAEEKQTDGTGTYVFTRRSTSSRQDNNLIVSTNRFNKSQNYGVASVRKVLRDVFLPRGYPTSVSSDYWNYQVWDTVQAFCSTINSTLTTHAIFKGVGVGDKEATALAATITWIMKDGTGMIGRIGFAWWKGYSLDTDCKKWRLVADISNDFAMCLELLLGLILFKDFGPVILCISTGMKSIVGVAGGATRAAITQHQAIRGNMGDVSAKDGSQETCVNLLASFLGVFLLSCIENKIWLMWILFFFNTTLHIFANYKAVKSLNMKTLNESRFLLLIQYFLKYNNTCETVVINQKEDVFLGFGISDRKLTSRRINLGCSLRKFIENRQYNVNSFQNLRKMYSSFPYLISYSKRNIDVLLQENISNEDIIKAYFHAVILGVVLSWTSSVTKSLQLHSQFNTLIEKCYLMGSFDADVNDFVNKKWNEFSSALISNGWNLEVHQLSVDEFRVKWP